MNNALNTNRENENNEPVSLIKVSRFEEEGQGLTAKEALEQQHGVRLLKKQAGEEGTFSEVSFELSEGWNKLYGILRGLSELYRSPAAFIKSNHQTKSFTLYFNAEAKKEVKAFLELVFSTLDKEMHFRKVLRQWLSMQRRQQKENELIFKQLF
ncbi:hypothetical protein [Pleomorphovibrio marinus]|uniref:hypothetical protein n=1 Tax=Pleomorphovibrio marinus TaxID=2164132 RepID=UPI000E0BACCA|nr:hypothetical protein [Pleomorphovibrio marinus]